MNKLMTFAFVAGLTLTSTFASAAALCPPSSCNPHNGCMEGCSNYSATGVAACNDANPKAAEDEALKNGVNFAYASCAYNFFLTSKWQIEKYDTQNLCQVRAHATFSCYQ